MAEFLSRAAAVPAARWGAPCAPGKWSPAQEVEHITLSYEIFGAELDGGVGMQPMASKRRQLFLRWMVLPFILRTGKFPGQPRAPREVRPVDDTPGKDVQLNRLRAVNEACDQSWRIARRERPRHRLSHAYFGMLSLDDALRLMTVHTRHHGRKLVSASAE
ncbi:MAG: DinB family protein [Gemmatimonadota bacterium]|nr:DinB family protein [Gemmatimonadota bacterium]